METYRTWIEARTAAIEKARRLQHDVAIRCARWYGKEVYTVAIACAMDSDYTRAEIVKPTDQI